MFGDPVENLQWDLEFERKENERLKLLVYKACKLAFENTNADADAEILQILKEAGLLKPNTHLGGML